MEESAFDLLLSLPTVLSCEIISTWLYVPNLAKLDSAYCNQKQRRQLHTLYEQPELICSLDTCPRKDIAWLLIRKIKFRRLDIDAGLPTDVVTTYLKEFGALINSVKLTEVTSEVVHKAVAANCPNVITLALDCMADVDYETLNTFKSVEKLISAFTSLSNFGSIDGPLNLPNLRKLIMCPALENISEIATLGQKFPDLTHLSLLRCASIAASTAVTMLSQLKRLVAVSFNKLPIDDVALITIVQNCPAIAHLDLSQSRFVTDVGILSVATMLKLKSLSLPCNYELTDQSLEYLGHCANSLQELHIMHNMDDGYTSSQLTMTSIRTLLAQTNNCVHTWTALIPEHERNLHHCANATTICINGPWTDALLGNIARHCKLLRIVDLYWSSTHANSHYTSIGLCAIIVNCPRLKTIHIRENLHLPRLDEVIRKHTKLFVRSMAITYDVMNMV